MDRQKVETVLKGALEGFPELFLIDLTVTAGDDIYVRLDGDQGVSLEDCARISRYLEERLDSDTRYTLEVSSAGVGEPLRCSRQYLKNRGRTLDVLTKEGVRYKALLKEANEREIILEWTEPLPKTQGKGKKEVVKQSAIPYDDIAQAKVLVKF